MFKDKKIMVFDKSKYDASEEEIESYLKNKNVDYEFITVSSQSVYVGGIGFNNLEEKEYVRNELNKYLGNQ